MVGRVLELLSTPAFRGALLAHCGRGDGEALGKALADLGYAQSRLQTLDDDYYVRGVLAAPRLPLDQDPLGAGG